MPSERATARSVAPHSFLRRRISRIRRIDTLSAGIGFPPVAGLRRTGAAHRPAVERSPPQRTPTSDRNGRHHAGIGGRDHLGISGRLGPESATGGSALTLSGGRNSATRNLILPRRWTCHSVG